MASRGPLGPQYFSLPLRWRDRPEIISLTDSAKLLFILLVELCFVERNGGRMTFAQVQSVACSVARGRQSVDRLLAAGCLLADGPLTLGTQSVAIAEPARWHLSNNQSASISADQGKSLRANAEKSEPRARAHVKREREREREEERTPSGSVRSSSARAAPRDARGAAHPTLEDQDLGDTVDEFDDLTGPAKAKAALAKGIANSPVATGQPTKMRRFPVELNSVGEPSPPVILSREYR